MAKLVFSSTVPTFSIVLLLLCFSSGGMVRIVTGQAAPGQTTWCIAKPSAQDDTLQGVINFACGEVDCKSIQQGGSCYYPPTNINHASVAMNLYYQSKGRSDYNCNFNKVGVQTITDPTYGSCLFPSQA